ncbi:50S ribosomal protein L11 [Candidatus Pacearchaeota archaeon]|nr:50S ribosomal protein L11 [Candidatus Pacearchaeota archaeon]
MKVGLLVDGGAMTPGPALAQKLGPLGIDIGKVIADVNKATMSFKGTKVPVELDVDTSKKTYTISVSTPPIPELLKKELGAEKGSGDHKNTQIGNLAIEQVIKVAKTKLPGMLEKNLKNAVKTVVGSCVSIGVLIENKPAKKVAVEVQEGIYDKEIAGEKTEVSPEKRKALDKYFSDIKSKQEALKKKAEEEKALAEQEKTKEAAAKPAETETKETKDASAKTPAGKPAAGKETAKSVAKPAAKKEAKK